MAFGLPLMPGGGTQDPFKALSKPLGLVGTPVTPARSGWEEARPRDAPASVEGIRDLTAAEAAAGQAVLAAPRAGGEAQRPITAVRTMRAWHHEAARLMSCGLNDTEIAEALDCRVSTLSHLRRSPAFQELLRAYATEADHAAIGIATKLRVNAALALDRIEEVLSETPADKLPLNWLKDIAVPLLDRAGFAPISKSMNVNAQVGVISTEMLRSIKEGLREDTLIISAEGRVLPATGAGSLASDPAGPPPATDVSVASEDQGIAMGGAGLGASDPASEAQGGEPEREGSAVPAPSDTVAPGPLATSHLGRTLDPFR